MFRFVFIFITLNLFFINSCVTNNTSEHVAEITDTVELKSKTVDVHLNSPKQINLEIINIDSDSYYSVINKMQNDTISDIDAYRLKDFTRLKSGQTQFKYYLFRELNFYSSFDSYLIAEYYESEESCWLVNYDKKKNIISSFEIFYDNAEGAWNTSTIINESQKTLLVTTYDAYADPSQTEQLFMIDIDGNIIEKKYNKKYNKK